MPVESQQQYRLVTRSDFDGLICAVLLKELNMIDDIKFVHPKDMQDGKVEITERDITTNLPFVSGAHLAFDHHLSETVRNTGGNTNHVIDAKAPSAARVVYDYYGGKERFSPFFDEMMAEVDKADSAQFSMDEVLNPKDWVLLNFLMDARTGLGRFREFRISNYDLMMALIDACKTKPISEILEMPDVVERKELFFAHAEQFKDQLERCSTVTGHVIVLDLRNEETIYAGNRFMIYALYPQAKVSIHVLWGLRKMNVALPVGKSIFDRTSKTNIGELMLKYGGGGHFNAGTCQVDTELGDQTVAELIAAINADG